MQRTSRRITGHLRSAVVLLAWGASRQLTFAGSVLDVAEIGGHDELVQFFAASAGWDRLCFAHELAVAVGEAAAS